MMRFISDFDKADKMRNMGFTLQIFLTCEIIVTAATYYTLSMTEIIGKDHVVDELVYLSWMAILALSMLPMPFLSPVNFAILRAVFRVLHMISIIVVVYFTGVVLVPPAFMAIYTCELIYLVHGINGKKMDFPGRMVAHMTDMWHEKKSAPRVHPFTSVAHEVIRKNCTIEEEFLDELFDYHTAYEDDLFPIILKPKTHGTFIV